MLKNIITAITLLILNALQAQVKVEAKDLKNFYIVFDSIQTTSDTLIIKQNPLSILQVFNENTNFK